MTPATTQKSRREKTTFDRMTTSQKILHFFLIFVVFPAFVALFTIAMKYAFFIIMPLLMYWQYRDLKKWRQLH